MLDKNHLNKGRIPEFPVNTGNKATSTAAKSTSKSAGSYSGDSMKGGGYSTSHMKKGGY